ncbi:MAG: EAL domain-containing protein, partial [Candidatus Gracilibacteria bacterium]|nr:EAL domain-containing protein [Candidatus Gracilibacteria bacterium]
VIRSDVALAHSVGATVTAEYVENKEIYEILLELGVDHFQGWYFAKAVPLDEIEWGELQAA